MRSSQRIMVYVAGLCLLGSLLMTVAVLAQQAGDQGKLKVGFEDATIGEVMKVLAAAGKFQYSLPPQYQDRRVTVSLADVTPEEALQVVLNQADLKAVNDNGVWTVSAKSNARAGSSRGGGRGAMGVATGAASVRTPPTVTATAPTTTTAAQQQQQQNLTGKREGEITRILQLRYMDPGLAAMLYGGTTIYGDENLTGGNSGNGNGNNNGGYGNNNGGYGNNNGGNRGGGGYGGRSNNTGGGGNYGNRGY